MKPLMKMTTVAVALVSAVAIGDDPQAQRGSGIIVTPTLKCGALDVTIAGTNGDDIIEGTPGHDVIHGLGGNDVIRAGDGEDTVCGGTGDDYIEGQGDEDVLRGDQGDDVLDGGEAGCCTMATNTGDDVLSGGTGNDVLYTSDFPQAGNTLHGEHGDDKLFLWTDGQAIGSTAHANGGPGNDMIFLYSGDGDLDGGGGRDIIIERNSLVDDEDDRNVTMTGGSGDDQLVSEDSNSEVDMDGGGGDDTCEDGDTNLNCETVI